MSDAAMPATAMNAADRVRAGYPLLADSFADWRTPLGDGPSLGGDLFTNAPASSTSAPSPAAIPHHPPDAPLRAAPHVPRALMDMLQSAACCRVPDRWAFLYRVIWRWGQGEHDVQSPADADGARLHGMVKAVRREEHDMHAYIRFRERPLDAGAPRFVAWYEPRHDVLPQVAQHFVKRMGKVSWLIATPEASVLWDGEVLHNTGPLARSEEELNDSGEALWLTYYRSIFNPARLNTAVMQQHITSDRWKNLPEGKIVAGMVSDAALGARRTGQLQAVGERKGTTIPILPADAQPERQQPTRLDECRRCELYQFATQAVPGEGPKQARIMLVGEQPGDQEDLAGQPFVGPAGKLLDRVCAQAGVDRDTVYVTNAVKHFKWEPRGKRRIHKTPAQREVEACHYWLEHELDSVNPTVVVALGATALKSVLGSASVTLKDSLGKPLRHGGRWVVTTYHPSYVLRVPGEDAKQDAFAIMVQGLKLAQELLDRPVDDQDGRA
jgi:probable DNA metabolism protein